MKKLATIFLTLVLLIAPSMSFAAYVSENCPGDPLSTTVLCPKESVGWFMQGITNACGNAGNCTLNDLMTVVANVGNFVLRIIGAVVLFMYVLGGFWYLVSHGDPKLVEKGKTALKVSTTGLVIVMFAYLGVTTLKKYITNQASTGLGGVTYVASCSASTEGQACALNKKCAGGTCIELCTVDYSGTYSCVEKNVVDASKLSSCVPNKCSSSVDTLCCPP
ncbi:hypothetical protein A3C09_02325 [Candidatus Uhrbacteria bacterium RIFCSPHIGHO2_02_FULL_47_44]|uniref:Uncharacterized protein n=1 Tax=Candidatus Uhrbacteria bacterium RIFCSPLOWO2_02_FULL_48_18 TaxID=1802408 RepID=A0A1F7V6Z9_9BACT|nr:MAG: hypothetical protein A2839_01515 [Candidatus Uhrbacteria bacterium RIFCSPHIGHO2_01_FULL_47_10]OGL71190.1 MAG: hypothetical protein A3C09_02325 [Candidatus Uhrbacteria bacterium RIFCSPHIGHO2_02_FULL_47_44]OGL77260.1 MAG: hypothetical protein A3E97_01165 [Candidatus Uhrbacteria bacterium RIFCSPHIGHO2_12_FULL_47_12]OGL80486.1 MAG: hypothetical protein A3B20_03710 [Candidatus Uhrbacteria bacterium RIFCSPLOWO2_01_FULL_47_17]OGL86346.1 MAG: hypothetical protein A3I41_02190 [Candidatus Uhrbact